MKLRYIAYLFLLSILNFSVNYAMEERENGSKEPERKESAQQNTSNKKSKEVSTNLEIVPCQCQVMEESEDESEQSEFEDENPIIDNLSQMIDNFANSVTKKQIKNYILFFILFDDIQFTSIRDLIEHDFINIEELIKKAGGQELLNLINEDFKVGSLDNALKDYYRGNAIKTILLKSLRTDDMDPRIKQAIERKIEALENNATNAQQRSIDQNLLTKIKFSSDRLLYSLLFFGVIWYLFENRTLYAEYLPSMSTLLIESTVVLILLSKFKEIVTYIKNCVVLKHLQDQIQGKNTLSVLPSAISNGTSATVRSSNSRTSLHVPNSSRLTEISSLLDNCEEISSGLSLHEKIGVFLRNLQKDLPKDKFEQFRKSLIQEMSDLIILKNDFDISKIIDQLNSVSELDVVKILLKALLNSGIRQLPEYQRNLLENIKLAQKDSSNEQKKKS